MWHVDSPAWASASLGGLQLSPRVTPLLSLCLAVQQRPRFPGLVWDWLRLCPHCFLNPAQTVSCPRVCPASRQSWPRLWTIHH